MKQKLYMAAMLLNAPFLAQAGLFPEGKHFEFIGIIGFLTVAIGGLFIYYFIWKARLQKEAARKEKYVIKSVQVVKNGRTFVKSKRIYFDDQHNKNPSLSGKSKPKRS